MRDENENDNSMPPQQRLEKRVNCSSIPSPQHSEMRKKKGRLLSLQCQNHVSVVVFPTS